MEDVIYVRVIAYRLDCINCKGYADSGQFAFKGAFMDQESIGKKYIDQAAFSIGNTILKLLGYINDEDQPAKKFLRPREMQETHQSELCGACKFGDCVWTKEANKMKRKQK